MFISLFLTSLLREDFPHILRISAEVEAAATEEDSHNYSQDKPRQPLTATVLLHCHLVLTLLLHCHPVLTASPTEKEQEEKDKQEENVTREKQNKQKKEE